MNVIQAAIESMALARDKGWTHNTIYECSMSHLEMMLQNMHKNPANFTDDKLNRYLGWMQACIVMNSFGKIDLEDMKFINKRNK